MRTPNHPFLPVLDQSQLDDTLAYIAAQAAPLAKAVLGHELPIDTLCIFTHDDAEYRFVAAALHKLGTPSRFSHEPTLYVDTKLQIGGYGVKILGVRKPDETRPWVGYADYPVADYPELLAEIASNENAKQITSGRGQSLIELRHPDFDTLGFVFDETEH
jgi:hypothetical protein